MMVVSISESDRYVFKGSDPYFTTKMFLVPPGWVSRLSKIKSLSKEKIKNTYLSIFHKIQFCDPYTIRHFQK